LSVIHKNLLFEDIHKLGKLYAYMRFIKNCLLGIIVSLCVFSHAISFGQQLTLFNIDTSNYPRVKADFFAIDNVEKQIITFTEDDVFITENTLAQQVLKVVNPIVVQPKQISLVLTIDVSSSMVDSYLKLAKSAANAIVSKLPLDKSECAITSFDDASYVHTDFTRDRNKLQKSIETLEPRGGTDYDKGFTALHAGGLDILKKGLHEKVLIFLTDGYGNVHTSDIIKKAKEMGAKVYVITMGMRTPDELKEIVRATNGFYFENIVSEEEINTVYLSVLYRIQGLIPSTIEWESTATCGYSKDILFGDKKKVVRQTTTHYDAPIKNSIRLLSDANAIAFNSTTKEIPISLKAVNGNFSIQSFNSSKVNFSIASPALPYTISKGSSENFIIKYTGSVADFISGRIELNAVGCPSTFIYYQYQPPTEKPAIHLISPEGKELFYTGMDTIIRWSLQNTYAPVKVLFSSNAGKDWLLVKDSCKGYSFNWKIPNKPGTTNLIKVETIVLEQKIKTESKVIHDHFTGIMNAYNLSPDGDRYISQTPTQLSLHDTHTNLIIAKIENTIKDGYYIFSPDGKYIIIYDTGKPIQVYDAYTFRFIEDWGIFNKTLSSFIEPYINNDLTEYVGKDANGSLCIFNFKTGARIKRIDFVAGKEVTDFTPKFIVSLEETNHHVWVWDHQKGNKVLDIAIPKEQIVNAEFNRDETVLFVYTWGADGVNQNFTAYDLSGKKLYAFENSSKSFMSLDTYQNYAICSVANYPALVDLNTGKVLLTYVLPTVVKFGWFVPFSNGAYILFTNAVSKEVYMVTSGIENIKGGTVSDQSAAMFTILSTKPEAKRIQFAATYVGSTKDSIIVSCIKNITSLEIPIKGISIEGTDARAFKILNPISVVTLHSKSKQDVEIRFAPIKVGKQEAVLKIITQYDTVRVVISGMGMVSPYSIIHNEWNVGLIEVGKTIDTTFSKVITNTSKSIMYIDALRLLGPDEKQFKITSPTTLSLAAGASLILKINFSPTQRGRTSTQLRIDIRNALSPVLIPIYGEGYLPRKYTIQYTVVDAVTKKSIAATIGCVDVQSKLTISSTFINVAKGSSTNVYADRIYVFSIQKEGYKSISDTINLLRIVTTDTISKTVELIPDGSMAPVTQMLKGRIVDKSNQSAINATIVIFPTGSKEPYKEIKTAADGTYSIELPLGTYAIQVEKEGYVNEHVSVEISAQPQPTTTYELKPIKVGETVQLPNVYFARGGVELLESSNESLDRLYTLLQDNPTMHIELLGYTDNQGDATLNIQLSEKRVAAIKDYLVAKGISETRITGKGYGGAKPIASNAKEETRQLNRRVEFKIVSK
jgi:outer membrane protein OmpA-like peptidoglycan-associated protein/WD40 repeat protein